ncbi:MAG: CidA/LrgA family protein [Slackia sp.]|nr:CidA/LrgA family protein [Slackia sp.]
MCISAPETNRDETRRPRYAMQNAAAQPNQTSSPTFCNAIERPQTEGADTSRRCDDAATCGRPRKRDKAKRSGKRLGELCLQLAFLAGVCYVGSAVSDYLPIAVPGNICSMIILLTLLISGMIVEEKIALASNLLLKYMPVFFIPAGVTIMTSLPLIQGRIPQFILVCLLTTFLVFLATSVTVIVVTRLQKYVHAKRAGEDVHLRKVLSIQGDPFLATYEIGETKQLQQDYPQHWRRPGERNQQEHGQQQNAAPQHSEQAFCRQDRPEQNRLDKSANTSPEGE